MNGSSRFLCWFVLLFMLIGCSENESIVEVESLSESAATAKHFLEEKGYEVLSLVSDTREILTEDYLNSIRGEQEWNLQPVASEEFVGKPIDRVMFSVENHPLNEKYEGEIRVLLILHEKKSSVGYHLQ